MKRKIMAAIAVILTFSVSSCGNLSRPDPNTINKIEDESSYSPRRWHYQDDDTTSDEESQADNKIEYSPEEDPEKFIKATIENMTLEEKIGQLFIVRADALETGYDNKTVNDDTIGGVTYVDEMMVKALKKYNVGGITLKEKNIIDEDKLIELTTGLQDNSKYPLFIGVDEIGGDNATIANNVNFAVPLFDNMDAVKTAKNAKKLGKTIGKYLVSYGVNLDFAPVADVSEDNKKIGSKIFSDDPLTVDSLVEAEIDGLHESRIMTAVGHFPGYGDDNADGEDVPKNDSEWDEIMDNSGTAFTTAIKKSDMLMIGHILLPEVSDDELPASMSKQVIQDKIRDELGYKGVIITDAMSAKCITNNYIKRECAVNAIIAGADIVLMPYDLEDSIDAVLKAVDEGKISESMINKRVERILTLKVKRGLFDDHSSDNDISGEDTVSSSAEE